MVEEKFDAKIGILKRKWRFRGFRHRWFQIFRSRSKIRKELEKSVLDFRKLVFESKIPNRNPISGFEVPISYFSGNRIFPKSKFQILAESISAFSLNFEPKFWFWRVYIPKSSSHLAKYPKILFAKFFFNRYIYLQPCRYHTLTTA